MEHYWGGQDDRFFYARETGRIVGDVEQLTDGTWSACYYDNAMKLIGTFIDDARARKAVEKALENHIRWCDFMDQSLQVKVVVDEAEPQRKWWQVWKL